MSNHTFRPYKQMLQHCRILFILLWYAAPLYLLYLFKTVREQLVKSVGSYNLEQHWKTTILNRKTNNIQQR